MSGRAKRIAYWAADLVLLGAAFGAAAWIAASVLVGYRGWDAPVALVGALLCVALRIPAAVHELGHLLFGALAGMKCVSVTISYLRIGGGRVKLVNPAYAGAVEAFPKNGERVKAKFFAMTFGGAVFNVLAGGVLLALYLVLPFHPALFFCGILAPFMFYEGISALLPAQLPAGKTDGAVLCGLMKGDAEEEIALRVLTAQGILYRGSFSDIPRPLLFDVPVVREDLPAFGALLILRTQYLLDCGEREEAEETLVRFDEIGDAAEALASDADRCRSYLIGEFEERKNMLGGVAELEKKLLGEKKNSAR